MITLPIKADKAGAEAEAQVGPVVSGECLKWVSSSWTTNPVCFWMDIDEQQGFGIHLGSEILDRLVKDHLAFKVIFTILHY